VLAFVGRADSSSGASSSRPFVVGKLTSTLTYGGVATMDVWESPVGGGPEADTGDNMVVHDWVLSSGQSVAVGVQVVAAFNGRRLYVIAAQCP